MKRLPRSFTLEKYCSLMLACSFLFAAAHAPAAATGTARIQQRDGSVKIYKDVRIQFVGPSMALTSSDGKGTIVIGKAACSKFGALLRCFPYDAMLYQHGQSTHIALQSGTVWLNPSSTKRELPKSSTQLPPDGVLLAMQTKAGTYVSLDGVADQITK